MHDVWQTEQGLPENSVRAISQTRDGYLWIGTEDGLARFDGVRFTLFDKENTPGMKNNIVLALLADREGNLWIGTNGGGLSRYRDGKFAFFTTKDGLSSDSVDSIQEDREGTLWIGSADGGLNRFKDGKFTAFRTKKGVSSERIESLYEDHEGSLWIATDGQGLTRFRDGKSTTFTKRQGLSGDRISSVHEDGRGSLWIGTFGGGVNLFRDGKFTAFTTKDGLSNDLVSEIYEDRDGNLWIGTYGGGLNRFTDGKFTAFTTKDGLSNGQVLSIFEDREGSLWIGTFGGGLNRFRDGKFTTFTKKDGLSTDMVASIYEDREGSLWMATYEGGLNRFRDGKFTTFTKKDGLSTDLVMSVYEDREGNLWIGTAGGGLNRFRDGKFTAFTTKDGLSSNDVAVVYEDRERSLWIGTLGKGLNRLRNGKFTPFTTKEGLSVLSICEDREGHLWIGTAGHGLYRFVDGKFTSFASQVGLSNDDIESIYEDRDGSLWIGTDGGGLTRFKEGKSTAFTTKDGLFDNVVFQTLEDGQGNFWMSCNKGIFRANKKELDAFANGTLRRVTCVSYGTADGMRSAECNSGQPAGWRAHDGRLWFPTTKGAVAIDPAHIPVNRLPPPVVMEEVRVDKKVLAGATARSPGVVPPGSEKFEFHYTALSFLAPQRVKFRYRLQGFDKDWVDAGTERTAYYTHLPPRKYRFRVIASNDDGVWNEQGASIDFVVAPFFYQTRLFISLLIIALLAVAYATYRARIWQLKARERELLALVEERTHSLAEEKRKTEEANQAKSLFLASMSHELRTPLNAVLGFVQLIGRDRTLKAEHREHLSIITQSGEHLLGLINDVLSISRIEAGQLSLREEAFDLSELLAGLKEVYGARAQARGLWLKVGIAPGSPLRLVGDAGKLRQVLINLLENAFRFTESGGISVLANWTEGMAEFVIEDTGHGMSEEDRARIFHVFGQAEAGERSKTGTGLGLYISRSFVRTMGGDIDVASKPGEGSRFTFRVYLPMAPSEGPEQSPAPRVVALEAGQRLFRVLVADDLVENRTLLVKLLTDIGLEVREAANGEEAVEVFTTYRPDVIFMDIRMPVLDGYGATRQIRDMESQDRPAGRRTCIIGLTASAFDQDREAVLGAGCDEFIAKPFRESMLFELMERHAGMRFVREAAVLPEQSVDGESVLTRARLGSVPADMRVRLQDSLERGDLQEARNIVEEIRAHDDPVATALADSMRAYRIDQLLALVQGAGK